jgi:hypothetical protein
MSLGATIAIIAGSVVSGLFVLALFVWGAVKDGQDQDARDAREARVQRRSWPGPPDA